MVRSGMSAQLAIIRELSAKIDDISADQRGFLLRHLTDLFLVNEGQLSADEVELIDDIFVRLMETIEESARALLGIRLAPIAGAPPKILRLLACDDAIEVASAILTQSEAVNDDTLIACSKTKSQEHLLAISQRRVLSEALTEVLVERGDQQVLLSTTKNSGARFSEAGFDTLIKRAQGNDELAGCVGSRRDLPRALFDRLITEASAAVRAKLKAERQFSAHEIDRTVSEVTTQLRGEADEKTPEWAAARVLADTLNKAGKLNSAKITELAVSGRFENLATCLALMAHKPVDIVAKYLQDSNTEIILVLAKVIGLTWETAWAIVTSTRPDRPLAPADLEKDRATYRRMLQPTARQILDFHCARIGKDKTTN